VAEVATFVRQLKNLVVARDNKFMCYGPGRKMIDNGIRDFGLSRIIAEFC
jgi:heterodisulfide reductase subunit A-like polyferredoxin